jgi:hypothetical protein
MLHAGVVLLLLAGLTACASAPRQDREGLTSGSWTPRAEVSAKELQTSGAVSAFEALRRVRPELFLERPTKTLTDPYGGFPVVYLDGRLQGTLDLLNTIPVSAILGVQYFSAMESHARFGRYHSGGVIDIRTRGR